MSEKERLLNVQEASRILGVAPKTLYQWRWMRKHLPFVKVGKSLRVREKDLMRFIRERKENPC